MKGVVKPQARPTRRKPRVQLRIEGEGWGEEGDEEGMEVEEEVDVAEGMVGEGVMGDVRGRGITVVSGLNLEVVWSVGL